MSGRVFQRDFNFALFTTTPTHGDFDMFLKTQLVVLSDVTHDAEKQHVFSNYLPLSCGER